MCSPAVPKLLGPPIPPSARLAASLFLVLGRHVLFLNVASFKNNHNILSSWASLLSLQYLELNALPLLDCHNDMLLTLPFPLFPPKMHVSILKISSFSVQLRRNCFCVATVA